MSESGLKKIIIIGPAWPYRGGNSLFVSHVFDSLKTKFKVKILNYKLLYPSILFPGTTQYDKSSVLIKKAENQRVINSINPFTWFKTAKMILKEKPDLVVFDWWHPFFGLCHFTISLLIKKKMRNKILFITENFVSHESNFPDKLLTRIGLSNASSFLALSDKVEKELRASGYKQKIYRSELPVYDCYKPETSTKNNKERIGFSDDNKVLLFFGYIRHYKGLDILIEAMPGILTIYPEARLLVVGEFYDNPSSYLDKIKELGIEEYVKIINRFVPNEEVGQYYQACDLNILPYRSATQSGILNVSYGFEVPVLVTRVGGLTEFIVEGKTGLIIDPGSAEAIVNGVKEFFDLSRIVDFAGNIKDFVKQNKFEKLPELFQEIIEEKSK
jgi:glycosyltransferase involved in cell wall biosynthesis